LNTFSFFLFLTLFVCLSLGGFADGDGDAGEVTGRPKPSKDATKAPATPQKDDKKDEPTMTTPMTPAEGLERELSGLDLEGRPMAAMSPSAKARKLVRQMSVARRKEIEQKQRDQKDSREQLSMMTPRDVLLFFCFLFR
jgi:hypothetical protein